MKAPKRIWVDSCKDADGEPEWDTGAWGGDQHDGDEEYVRADLFAKAVEALRYYAVEALPWDADDSLIARAVLAELGEMK
jgi:hypothetical protein